MVERDRMPRQRVSVTFWLERPMRCLLFVIAIFCITSVVNAQENTFVNHFVLKCHASEVHGVDDVWRDVDRIEVDADKMTITFSISKTLGTDRPTYWLFANHEDSLFRDHAVFGDGHEFLGIAAIYTNVPVAILLTRHETVQMVWLYPVAIKYAKYDCEP
jgi:hypothetical protein